MKSMTHLTYDELASYLQTDIEDYTDEEARLMAKVSNHFDECEHCVAAFYDMMYRHSAAEILLGEPIPLGKKAIPISEAISLGNIVDIAQAALNKLVDTVDELSGDVLQMLDRFITKGFSVEDSLNACLSPALSSARGSSEKDSVQKITVDDNTHSIILEESSRIILTSPGENATSVLVVSQDGEFVKMYPLIDDGVARTVTTDEMPKGEYRIVALQDKI